MGPAADSLDHRVRARDKPYCTYGVEQRPNPLGIIQALSPFSIFASIK